MVADGGSRSGAAYTRFAEEMDIDSVDLQVREGQEGKLGAIKGFICARRNILLIIVLCFLCLFMGIIIDHYLFHARRTKGEVKPVVIVPNTTEHHKGEGRNYISLAQEIVSADFLETYLRKFTRSDHSSGSIWNQHVAQYIQFMWGRFGFNVTTKNYTVKVWRPGGNTPSKIVVYNSDDPKANKEYILDDRKYGVQLPASIANAYNTDEDILPPFVSNTPNGTLDNIAPLFINYGTAEDFRKLTEYERIPIESGSRVVCLFKMGKVQLPVLIQRCKEQNGLGVLVYPDPQDYNSDDIYDVFPDSWWLPHKGVIRASTSPILGDPLTPYLPSLEGITENQEEYPNLPTMVLNAETAREILMHMHNPAAPEEWYGKFENASEVYYIGLSLVRNAKMRMEINNTKKAVNIENVLGTITGTVEPDHYVIIGNHRDSLTSGAVEPGTGSAVFMELTRVTSTLLKEGWRPRRTIIFANWDGGDDGHIGSTEWVQENSQLLSERVVAYINLDEAVSGTFCFAPEGTPLLQKVLTQVTRNVTCPNEDHSPTTSVFDDWLKKYPGEPDDDGDVQPRLFPIGINSDSTPFLHLAGVPSVNLKFSFAKYDYQTNKKHIYKYPAYHTSYDTVDYLQNHIDSKFAYQMALVKIAAGLMLALSDDVVLPIDVRDYAEALQKYVRDIQDMGYDLSKISNFDKLTDAIDDFENHAEDFHQNVVLQVDIKDPVAVREVNSRLISIDRAFLDVSRLHVYPQLRHLVYGPSAIGAYDGEGLSALKFVINNANATDNWLPVPLVVSATTAAVRRAEGVLRLDDIFT